MNDINVFLEFVAYRNPQMLGAKLSDDERNILLSAFIDFVASTPELSAAVEAIIETREAERKLSKSMRENRDSLFLRYGRIRKESRDDTTNPPVNEVTIQPSENSFSRKP